MIVYHYCSVEKLESILKSKCFWLANLTKSNDKNEVVQTFDILWKNIKLRLMSSSLDQNKVNQIISILDDNFKLQVFVDNPFGVCFSDKGDILQQWNEYGEKTKGVSLGFDIDWFNHIEKDTPHPSSKLERSIGFNQVYYYDQNLEESFYKLFFKEIESAKDATSWLNIMATLRHYSAFIKHASFEGERELRIVYYPFDDHDYANNLLSLSELNEKPFQHYCLPWAKSNSDKSLKRLIIGSNCQKSQNEIATLLKAENIEKDVEIINSEIPYRV